ncbi:MAG: hypothetical protein PF961_17110 [Planctomycetota bacterium]|jgi:hypothetical protein|nr:hypothetical protein [Planctomycetota bacterium]
MRIVSYLLALLAIACLFVSGCDSSSSNTLIRDSNPSVSLKAGDGSSGVAAAEDTDASVDLKLVFSDLLTSDMSVSISVGGTATEGEDYEIQSKGLKIHPGDLTNGEVFLGDFIVLINDAEVEDPETITVTLSTVSYGQRSVPVSVVITLTSEDVAPSS